MQQSRQARRVNSPSHFSTLPTELLNKICLKLTLRDLSILSRVCHRLFAICEPLLYERMHFHLSGHATASDPLLRRLEAFSMPDFTAIKRTKRVLVSGTWYIKYDRVESQFTSENIVPPAIRMLGALLAASLAKMNLREFIWDADISMAPALVMRVLEQRHLDSLQLRLATNQSPLTFTRKLLRFNLVPNLTKLSVVQVDRNESLETVGDIVALTHSLEELIILADADAGLSLSPALSSFKNKTLRLHSLDLRGFHELGIPPQELWEYVSPETLKNLSLEISLSTNTEDDFNDFWDKAMDSKVYLKGVQTNLLCASLTKYLTSFHGLETMILRTSLVTCPAGSILENTLQVVVHQGNYLKVLGLHSQDEEGVEHLGDRLSADSVLEHCPNMEEFVLYVREDDTSDVELILHHPRLRALHICVINDAGQGYDLMAPNRPKILPRPRSLSQSTSASDASFLEYSRVVRDLKRLITTCVDEQGLGRSLEIVAFNNGPVLKLRHKGHHGKSVWSELHASIGHTQEAMILREKTFDWVGNYKAGGG